MGELQVYFFRVQLFLKLYPLLLGLRQEEGPPLGFDLIKVIDNNTDAKIQDEERTDLRQRL